MPDIHQGDGGNLQRDLRDMPDDVWAALTEAGLTEKYRERPAYQQNDYLGWIDQAKRPETRDRRIAQMLDELREGGVYMGMAHPPSKR
jgi:uncharacterized protein YdeI (YjbR/CyaY-like superfamily)